MNLADVTQDIKRADLLQMYYYLRLTRDSGGPHHCPLSSRSDRRRRVHQPRDGSDCRRLCLRLERDDVIAPFHRDMGAFLIRGITPGEVLAQYLGKRTGPSKGKDGNVHMGDLKRGMISFVSHLADNLPVATGVALAFKIRGERAWRLTGTGDGGTSRGDFHEAMNFAAVRKLPVVFFCNNNQYAYSTPQRLQMAIHDVADRAKALRDAWRDRRWERRGSRVPGVRASHRRRPVPAKGRPSSNSKRCGCTAIPSMTRPSMFLVNCWRNGKKRIRS